MLKERIIHMHVKCTPLVTSVIQMYTVNEREVIKYCHSVTVYLSNLNRYYNKDNLIFRLITNNTCSFSVSFSSLPTKYNVRITPEAPRINLSSFVYKSAYILFTVRSSFTLHSQLRSFCTHPSPFSVITKFRSACAFRSLRVYSQFEQRALTIYSPV